MGATNLKIAISMGYGDAERWYRQGLLSQAEWDLYRFYWRNSAPRFSDTAQEFELKV